MKFITLYTIKFTQFRLLRGQYHTRSNNPILSFRDDTNLIDSSTPISQTNLRTVRRSTGFECFVRKLRHYGWVFFPFFFSFLSKRAETLIVGWNSRGAARGRAGLLPSSKHFGQPKETHLPAGKHGQPWRRRSRSRSVLALPRGELET